MKTLLLMVDFDGCFNGCIVVNPITRTFKIEGKMFDHICGKVVCLGADRIIVISYSNRQDFSMESTNSLRNKTISSFQAFAALASKLKQCFPEKEVILDKYLLSDSAAGSHFGASWDAILQSIYGQELSTIDGERVSFPILPKDIKQLPSFPFQMDAISDKQKLLMFYIQAHRTCHNNQGEVNAVIYEDTEENLQAAYCFMRQYKQLFPKNLSVQMYAYNAPLTKKQFEQYSSQSAEKRNYFPAIENEGVPEHYPYVDNSSTLRCAYSKTKEHYKQFDGNYSGDILRGTGGINNQWAQFYQKFNEVLKVAIDPRMIECGGWDRDVNTTARIIHRLHVVPVTFFTTATMNGYVTISPDGSFNSGSLVALNGYYDSYRLSQKQHIDSRLEMPVSILSGRS